MCENLTVCVFRRCCLKESQRKVPAFKIVVPITKTGGCYFQKSPANLISADMRSRASVKTRFWEVVPGNAIFV